MIQVTVPNFFYFAEISKMSELEPKNVDFSLISGNAHGRKKNFKGSGNSYSCGLLKRMCFARAMMIFVLQGGGGWEGN